jgi:hypothetical protein
MKAALMHRRDPSLIRRAAVVVASTLVLVASAAATSTAATTAGTGTTTAAVTPARENISFFYQQITNTTDLSRLGDVKLVVAGQQQDDTLAAARIKQTGAKAYRYVQSYWFPKDKTFDGLDIGAQPDWAFCASGTTPMPGRTDATGTLWWFLDMNEQPVQQFFLTKFLALKAAGWDGVFLDRGFAALTGLDSYKVSNKVSTCTGQPVTPGATFASTYVGIMNIAKQAGMPLIINYGISPFDPQHPLRADAWSALSSTGLVLDESVSHPQDQYWAYHLAANRQNEQNAQHPGRVIGLLTTAILGGQTRLSVYYGWSKTKLFAIPLGVNTGDAGCANAGGLPCNQAGLYPELANVAYGLPISTSPGPTQCALHDAVHCLWFRRYQAGMSLLNASSGTRTGVIPLGVSGCRYVLDLFTKRSIDGGYCVASAIVRLGPWEGHPLLYSVTPWPQASSPTPALPVPPPPAPTPKPVVGGYWMVGASGSVYGFGDAHNFGSASTTGVTHIEPTPSHGGYWIVNGAGQVFAYGNARSHGNAGPLRPGEKVSSLSATATGNGYWLFTNRGRVMTYGDARSYGDMSGTTLNGPVVGSVATPTGRGYYMVSSDGGIFAFGDARFHGSMGGAHLNQPVNGLVPTLDNRGYWLVSSDGGIFAFNAPFRGSMGGSHLNRPVIGMVRYGNGYLMVGSDGGIFAFSNIPFRGSLGANPPAIPIVGVAST